MSHLTHFDRARRLTGSQAAASLGMDKFTGRAKLWRQITGREPRFEGNVFTQYGNDNEPIALATLEAKMGKLIDASKFVVHPEIKWLGASPDGFLEGGIVEVKCPQTIHAECPEHYLIQMHVQMACCGCDYGWFASWTPDAIMVEKVTFDREWWDSLLLPGMDLFWNHYVANDIEPPRGRYNPLKESFTQKESA
jgi:putative phage-type endonuclease